MARTTVEPIELSPTSLNRYQPVLGDAAFAAFRGDMDAFATRARGRVVWNVNSTRRGGGVAELLGSLIPYDIAAGVDERWAVIEGSRDFFAVTKKIHTLLHGVAPDGVELTAAERTVYEETLVPNAVALLELIRPDDVALLHDPQTLGLIPALTEHGIKVVWRCHIGVDEPNAITRAAWRFLSSYLDTASAFVFSRDAYVWDGLERSRVRIIAPCIDAFTSKNRELGEEEARRVLDRSRALDQLPGSARLVLQVSRWDRLKDPVGVLRMFANDVAPVADAWLVLAGPEVTSVDDDPEQPEVLEQVQAAMQTFATKIRERIVIAQLPMRDLEENALMVNALQRRADIVVQKSVAEGFGLTVAEAMWKSRAVVASRVGGIEDQIENGKNGVLIDDANDLPAFGSEVVALLADRERAAELGRQAKLRVLHEFLAPRHLLQQAELISSLV